MILEIFIFLYLFNHDIEIYNRDIIIAAGF